jgi:hypothetical protein
MGNLIYDVKVTHLTSDGTNYPLAAATTDVESGYVDMAGYEGCMFILVLGDDATTGTLAATIEGCTTYNGTYAALTGATYTATDDSNSTDNKMIVLDVYQPIKQFLHVDINRGTANMVVQSLVAIQYNGTSFPITQAVTAGQFDAAGAVVAVQGV